MNPPVEPEAENTIALLGGRLIDGYGGRPVENAVVLIKGSTIVAAGPGSRMEIPDTAERVNARGMTILPGLIDTHFHSRDSVELTLTAPISPCSRHVVDIS